MKSPGCLLNIQISGLQLFPTESRFTHREVAQCWIIRKLKKNNNKKLSSLSLTQIRIVFQYFSAILLLHLQRHSPWGSTEFQQVSLVINPLCTVSFIDYCLGWEAKAQRSENHSACSRHQPLGEPKSYLPRTSALGPSCLGSQAWGTAGGNPSYSSEPGRLCCRLDWLHWTLYF